MIGLVELCGRLPDCRRSRTVQQGRRHVPALRQREVAWLAVSAIVMIDIEAV
jgi:hypothetical protein